MEFVLLGEVAQLRLALLHRVHAADKVGEGPVRGVGLKLVVAAPVGHVIPLVAHQQQIAAALHVQLVDDLLIECGAGLPVLQLRIPQGSEQLVLLPLHHLLGGKDDVDEVFPQPPGQHLFQQPQIALRLRLGHIAEGLVQVRDDLFISVDKAAIYPVEPRPVQPEPPPQLV